MTSDTNFRAVQNNVTAAPRFPQLSGDEDIESPLRVPHCSCFVFLAGRLVLKIVADQYMLKRSGMSIK